MPSEIELKAMNDHDLIVMNVMQSNETVRHLELINGTLKNHEKRIDSLEIQEGSLGNPVKRVNLSKTQAISISSGLIILGGFVVGIIERLL